MRRGGPALTLTLAVLALAGCAAQPPSSEQCEAAGDNIAELFAAANVDRGPVGERKIKHQRRNFIASCERTGTAEQAECATRATTLDELERCE